MKWKSVLLIAAACYCVLTWDSSNETILARRALGTEPPTAKWDSFRVDARVAAWQPTKVERAFDEIAWAKDLSEAERLAKEHGRAIFLFTYDGADLACYRC